MFSLEAALYLHSGLRGWVRLASDLETATFVRPADGRGEVQHARFTFRDGTVSLDIRGGDGDWQPKIVGLDTAYAEFLYREGNNVNTGS